MLTAEGCAARRRRLWEALPSACDLLLVADPRHLIYFANFAPSPFSFRSSDAAGILVLTPERSILVADNLVQPDLDRAHVDEIIAPVWYEGKKSAPPRGPHLIDTALIVLGKTLGRRVGVEFAAVPTALIHVLQWARKDLKLIALDEIIPGLRRPKDPDELDLIRRSIRAGEAGHAAALEQIQPGMTKLDVYRLVHNAALEVVGEPAIVYGDFDIISQGNPAPDGRLRAGDLFLLDFSVVINGYRGDFANTIVVGAEPSHKIQERYEGCVVALAAGEALLRPGTSARAVDAALRHAFAERGLDPNYPTHSGHGVGLSHPEPPYIVPKSSDTLQAGDVVTLEPGQYGPGFSLRFERNYRITPDGLETLTHHRIALRP
jgi:Xaa-Pro aminopeptidase